MSIPPALGLLSAVAAVSKAISITHFYDFVFKPRSKRSLKKRPTNKKSHLCGWDNFSRNRVN